MRVYLVHLDLWDERGSRVMMDFVAPGDQKAKSESEDPREILVLM